MNARESLYGVTCISERVSCDAQMVDDSHFLQLDWPFVSSITEGTGGFQTTQNATVADDIVLFILWVFRTYPMKKLAVSINRLNIVPWNSPLGFLLVPSCLVLAENLNLP